jgi:rSAM/selenodomain-associated transferase 1
MMHTAVVIMAKLPQPGAVKTRLCPPLSPQASTALYHAFLLDKIAQVGTLKAARPAIAYTPSTARSFFAALAPDFVLVPQQGEDLGARLANGLAQLFAMGYTGVLAIDSDTPTLPTTFLQQAVDLIATPQVDVVLGPSEDGGYYLIGLRTLYRELFENMAWSTVTVVPETVRRAEAKGLKVTWLPPWFDIDTPVDLERLQTALAQTDSTEPRHTRQFLLEQMP